jgi:hypothetical protein
MPRAADCQYAPVVSADESLDQLRTEISGFPSEPYLLTVTATNRPHCGTVTVEWDAAGLHLLVSPPNSWPESEANEYRQVSLLWPPPKPGGYSLIIDGAASTVNSHGVTLLAVAPTKAVLHRRGAATPDNGSSCGSDCIPILSR